MLRKEKKGGRSENGSLSPQGLGVFGLHTAQATEASSDLSLGRCCN